MSKHRVIKNPANNDSVVSSRMKEDWNSRAQENAKWFINTVGVAQSDDEFFAGGKAELEKWWLPDFRAALEGRDLRQLRVFELGCGIGRMTGHLAEVFGEIWAVDVSGEMIRQARQRFAHLTNVRWLEIDGVSLSELPSEYFDLGFSIYVYQHMPSKDVIATNIAGAYSRLREGGLYKFHTNGLVKAEFEEIEKDTWTGATFSDAEIRNLAIEMDAQLVGIKGGGTQYCWSTLRKRRLIGAVAGTAQSGLTLEFAGRADAPGLPEVPATGDDARLGLVLSGLDLETADCNSVVVRISDLVAQPAYVGRVPEIHRDLVASRGVAVVPLLGYVEVDIPEGIQGDLVEVAVECGSSLTDCQQIKLVQGERERPKIVTIRNGADYGTDIHSTGVKSLLVLYVHGLDESATTENVGLRLNEMSFAPDFVGFVRQNGTWQVNAGLPKTQLPGQYDLVLSFKGCESLAAPMVIKGAED
ncbi:MAG: class I SAM-dependent methyltransferase [Acidobacteriota bacterium]